MNASQSNLSGNWLSRRARSFVHAGRGCWRLTTEPNARIHLLAMVCALLTAAALQLSAVEWALIVVAIASVLAAEAVNTALERLADALMPERHPLIGAAKDLGAGAVLITAVGAAIVGVLVLGPHVCRLYDAVFRS
jgi:diacylglycerol kinase (ATP)